MENKTKKEIVGSSWIEAANCACDADVEPLWGTYGVKERCLSFDGPLVHVSSVFYPTEADPARWDGMVEVAINDKIYVQHDLEAGSLNGLRDQAEAYVEKMKGRLDRLLTAAIELRLAGDDEFVGMDRS